MASAIAETCALDIYRVLVDRKFRQGPLPGPIRRSAVLEQIGTNDDGSPVPVIQYWGGCKNPNLPVDVADAAEKASFENLGKLDEAVRRVYPPGLSVNVVTGGIRTQRVNHAPQEKTEKYHDSLCSMAAGYPFMHVIPMSNLYDALGCQLDDAIGDVRVEIWDPLDSLDGFDVLVTNAGRNLFGAPPGDGSFKEMCREAAKNYIVHRVAEERCGIFRDFPGALRASYNRHTPSSYRQFILEGTKPPLDATVFLYTMRKGDIVQPWQAVGLSAGDMSIYMTQKRLRARSTTC